MRGGLSQQSMKMRMRMRFFFHQSRWQTFNKTTISVTQSRLKMKIFCEEFSYCDKTTTSKSCQKKGWLGFWLKHRWKKAEKMKERVFVAFGYHVAKALSEPHCHTSQLEIPFLKLPQTHFRQANQMAWTLPHLTSTTFVNTENNSIKMAVMFDLWIDSKKWTKSFDS